MDLDPTWGFGKIQSVVLDMEERIRSLEAAGNDLRASVVAAYPIELPASAAERIRRFDALFASQAETPVRQVHSKSEYKRLTALGVECVVTEAETKP